MSVTLTDTLINDNLGWARDVARRAAKTLPPSFDVEGLEQEACIALCKVAGKYDPSTGVPFTAFAYQYVRGAVYMKARRKHYRAETMEELPAALVDSRPGQDEPLADMRWVRRTEPVSIDVKQWGPLKSHAPTQVLHRPARLVPTAEAQAAQEAEDARSQWLQSAISTLGASQAYLLRRALDGVALGELAACWRVDESEMRRRITAAVRQLRRSAPSELADLEAA